MDPHDIRMVHKSKENFLDCFKEAKNEGTMILLDRIKKPVNNNMLTAFLGLCPTPRTPFG